MAVVEKKEEKKKKVPEKNRLDEKLMEPGDYEVTRDTTFDIKIKLKKSKGRWLVVSSGEDVIQEVVFRMWNYDEMVEMRKMSMSYDSSKRMHMIDNDALNRIKIQKLLISWTFGDNNPRLKLNHTQGVMTDESWDAFKKLQPNIITYILDGANSVFEFNS